MTTPVEEFEERPLVRYWHGGTPGLAVGDLVLPPEQTGAPTLADFGAGGVCRRDRIYITTRPEIAVLYAAMHPSGRGKVYEVLPAGPLDPDPDWNGEPGLSLETTEARIWAMHEPGDMTEAGVVDQIRRRYLDLYAQPAPKVGRNEPCPCGSGRKAKKCCHR